MTDELPDLRTVPCAWGYCTDYLDARGKIYMGFGLALCPCDNMAGWNGHYPAGKPKPAPPVRATGRHGSRVQRSRHRHTYEREVHPYVP